MVGYWNEIFADNIPLTGQRYDVIVKADKEAIAKNF